MFQINIPQVRKSLVAAVNRRAMIKARTLTGRTTRRAARVRRLRESRKMEAGKTKIRHPQKTADQAIANLAMTRTRKSTRPRRAAKARKTSRPSLKRAGIRARRTRTEATTLARTTAGRRKRVALAAMTKGVSLSQ